MTDYDDVRFCCSGADICCDCWPLMTVAIKVVDTALRDDFGFNHILWVFSGQRGVHCWVCDAKARRLTNEQRAAITSYFHVYKGNENSLKKASLGGPALHPFLARSYTDYLKTFFEETFLCSQKLLSSEERYEKVLDLIPDESITSELRGKWQDSRRSSMSKEDVNVVRWGQLKQLLQSGKQKAQGIRRYVEEIVFSYVYPRLDMEVSKHMNHLLKAPFCVHPKTDVPSGCTYPTTSGPAGPVSNSTGIPTSPPGGINTPPGGMNTPPGGMNTGPGMTSPPGIFSPTSFGPTGSFGDPSLSGATSLLQMSSYIVSLSLTLFAGLLIVWG